MAFLRDWLEQRGRRVLTTREPGGTVLAERVRKLLLDSLGKVKGILRGGLCLVLCIFSLLSNRGRSWHRCARDLSSHTVGLAFVAVACWPDAQFGLDEACGGTVTYGTLQVRDIAGGGALRVRQQMLEVAGRKRMPY